MKKNIKKTLFGRIINFMTAAALVMACAPTIPVGAENYCDAEMYIPAAVEDLKGVVAGWDSTEAVTSDMHAGLNDQFSNADWFGITTVSGNSWKAGWGTTANHRYNTSDGTVTVQFPKNNEEVWDTLTLNKGITAKEVKYVIIGVTASANSGRIRMYARDNGWTDENGGRSAGLNIKKGYNELVCAVSSEAQAWQGNNVIYQWDADEEINRLSFKSDNNVGEDLELTFDYIRFVTDEYNGYIENSDLTGTLVQNGAENYDIKNNVVDFLFMSNLNPATVTEQNVTINNQPVKWVRMSNAGYAFRANLGELKKNTTYTIRFNGVKTEDGEDIAGEYTFSTPAAQILNQTPEMYLLPADLNGWKNTETPNADMAAGTKDVFSNAGWYDITTSGGGSWKAAWDTAASHRYNTAGGTVTVQYPKGQSADSWTALTLNAPVTAGDVGYLAIGVNSNIDTTRVRMYACTSGWDDGGSKRSAGLNIKKGDNEIICPVSAGDQAWSADNVIYQWGEDIQRLKFMADKNLSDDIELTFKYVRFVAKTGQKIENGATEYDTKNNVADFVFEQAMNVNSINTANVTINGQPVKAVTALEGGCTFRVDLGTLSRGNTYTVRFADAETADGNPVVGEFTFSTQSDAPIHAVPELRKPDTASFIGGWDCTETPDAGNNIAVIDNYSNASWFDIKTTTGNYWKYNWYTSVEHRYDIEDGTVSLRISPSYKDGDNDANPDTMLNFGTPVDGAAAKYLIIGMDSVRNDQFTAYVKQGTETGVVFKVEEGFHEYVLPLSLGSSEQITAIRFSHAPSGFDPFEVQFSYVRFADASYKRIGGGEEIAYTPYMEFDADNQIVDFVFPCDLDFDTVKAENITLNGAGAEYVLTDAEKPNALRAYFPAMTPITRCRVNIAGLQSVYGNSIIVDEYRFTTGSGESAPIMSWELVENYKTADEELLTADTAIAGKTITAVTGGLYNNSDTKKTYSLMIALYKDGALKNVVMDKAELDAKTAIGERAVQIDVPDDGNTYAVKAFAWDYDAMSPLCRTISQADSTACKPLKLLILGNSITKHSPNAGYGWSGYWGMAASAQDKDYVHQLISNVKSCYPAMQVKYRNIATIEGKFYEDIAAQVKENIEYREAADYNADIIVMTIGANIHNDETHTLDKAMYGKIVNTFKTNPNAKVVIGATTLTGDEVKNVLSGYAANNDMQFVDMVFTRSEHPEYFPEDGAYANVGVCLHPNDAGMKVMADALTPAVWQAVKAYHTN